MSRENTEMALSLRRPLNGRRVLRIPGSWQNEELKQNVRLATVNVGTLKGRAREVIEMVARRKVDIGCMQEVRYKGQEARMLGGGETYKLWWSGGEVGANVVGILVKEEHMVDVIEVVRTDDRIMEIKLMWGKKVVHIFSVYICSPAGKTRGGEKGLSGYVVGLSRGCTRIRHSHSDRRHEQSRRRRKTRI
ncbi:hypothetical protein Pcinc_002179 [Petrolisthes cinctipes]|uniref:Endonuclease/exonuclease/phosphatase domain-containing protein n=1 Tax=Petrolisthes cinctipes TaxID=88211 RepID=A0AAE1GLJ9_PETCI|nr:hypothetical protein Pcinc_002179 [Petrolisthes cinctipes]